MTSHPARDDDVPIVLLHGATSSARIWQPLLPNLTSRHRVIVPTLAGHRGGPSIPTGGGTTLERIVDDMCRQLDAAGIPPAHLVGNSLGGWVALELARRGRASSVLALSPAGGWTRAVDLQRMLLIFRVAGVLRRSKAMPRIAADPRRRRMLLRAMAEHADRLTTAQTAAIFEDMAECDVLAELIGERASPARSRPCRRHAQSASCGARWTEPCPSPVTGDRWWPRCPVPNSRCWPASDTCP